MHVVDVQEISECLVHYRTCLQAEHLGGASSFAGPEVAAEHLGGASSFAGPEVAHALDTILTRRDSLKMSRLGLGALA